MPNFGVRAGYVWRGQRNQYGRYNINRPYSAFTVPVRFPIRARRHASATPTTARRCTRSTWRRNTAACRRQSADQRRRQRRDYHTFEITGTKRMSNRWSLLASYGWTKSFDQRHDPGQRRLPRQHAAGGTP
jgi:hypothetical protein